MMPSFKNAWSDFTSEPPRLRAAELLMQDLPLRMSCIWPCARRVASKTCVSTVMRLLGLLSTEPVSLHPSEDVE